MKQKNLILALMLLLAASVQTIWAQGFRIYKTDGTVMQFSLRTDSIVFYDGIGTDMDFGPFTPINQMIVGTWYKSKTETVTFNEDDTTDYIEDATYKFFPYQGTIIIYNASGAPINIVKVYEVTAKEMVVSTTCDSNISVWNKAQPVQLVTSITLNETSLSLGQDETAQLTATVLPEHADNKEVVWESSDTNVATIDQIGKVTAVAKGTCTITATAADGSGVKAECTVTVILYVTDITLNETSLTLFVNATQALTATVKPDDANNKMVTWKSSNDNIATIDEAGKVTAVAPGSCTITATAADGSGVSATCMITVEHEWVDLGLPSGTLWATCNVGASSPDEYGDYFAWGETTKKNNYTWGTYKYCKGSEKTLTKYCTQSSYGYNGYTDSQTELLPEDDAATVNWGSGWQTPSIAQCKELYNSSYTTKTWTTQNGVKGRKVTSKSNGNSIFLPATGFRDGTTLNEPGENGDYWSRSLSTKSSYLTYDMDGSPNGSWDDGYKRCAGQVVRPVRVKK